MHLVFLTSFQPSFLKRIRLHLTFKKLLPTKTLLFDVNIPFYIAWQQGRKSTMFFCCGGKMPVYAVVARTQPPLSGSWGARLLTPALLPGIENTNILFPCPRANLTIRLFTPPTTRCRYILLKQNRFADVRHHGYFCQDYF
jgi:hypothetical protein